VSNETVPVLACVGVCQSGGLHEQLAVNNHIASILPGMEFIDGNHVMRVHEVQRSGQIHAIKAFKLLATGAAIKVAPSLRYSCLLQCRECI
jgi:hypothetical protein